VITAPTKEKVVVKSHPGGVAGAMMSLDEVAKRAWAARNDPQVRAWTTQQIAKAGGPTGTRERMQVVLDAYRKKVPYISDPVQSEFMAGPKQVLCLDSEGICIIGADCDEATITIAACLLSIGIPVQIIGASYKEPIDQPVHVYLRAQDESGTWVDIDGTTKFSVGNVHEPARVWVVDPNKGVGAAGLPGGDFVGVGRAPVGLAQYLTYVELLQQLVSQDLPALQASWASVEQAVTNDAQNDPCNGVGGPASLVPMLQDISDQACTIAHNASTAAFGYTLHCADAGAAQALAAQNATVPACTLRYAPLVSYLPYGTLPVSGQHNAYCLDAAFMSAVGMQVSAAEQAVIQAQLTAQACAVATTKVTRPRVRSGVRTPVVSEWGALARAGQQIGLGLVTPGDILAYRAMWNQYVLDSVGCAQACAQKYNTAATDPANAALKDTFTAYGTALQQSADALQSDWNLWHDQAADIIVLQAADILQQQQEAVLYAGNVRQQIKTSTLPCIFVYVNSKGQAVNAVPGADPSVQVQVIARIEGLGILSSGVLQILVEVTIYSLQAVGSATQWAAEQGSKLATALSTPWPWAAAIAVAGAVVVYEVWPRSR